MSLPTPEDKSKPKQPVVACPTCKGNSVFAASNAWRPFCSERCKDLDFGAWASESFRVPTSAPPPDELFGDAKLEYPH